MKFFAVDDTGIDPFRESGEIDAELVKSIAGLVSSETDISDVVSGLKERGDVVRDFTELSREASDGIGDIWKREFSDVNMATPPAQECGIIVRMMMAEAIHLDSTGAVMLSDGGSAAFPYRKTILLPKERMEKKSVSPWTRYHALTTTMRLSDFMMQHQVRGEYGENVARSNQDIEKCVGTFRAAVAQLDMESASKKNPRLAPYVVDVKKRILAGGSAPGYTTLRAYMAALSMKTFGIDPQTVCKVDYADFSDGRLVMGFDHGRPTYGNRVEAVRSRLDAYGIEHIEVSPLPWSPQRDIGYS
ncbi:MAG TPA: hypothetical protein VI933_04145 [archaeon]|nr:hypothetical protein [archaeon]